jgi:hypothetical protein
MGPLRCMGYNTAPCRRQEIYEALLCAVSEGEFEMGRVRTVTAASKSDDDIWLILEQSKAVFERTKVDIAEQLLALPLHVCWRQCACITG